MKIYETTLAKSSEIPSQIDFLNAAYHRGLLKSNEKIRLYQNLEAGAQGEQFVIDALQTYGRKHWVVLQNVWQDYFGVYESDIILITRSAVYIFEVKNFEGLFEYKESRCYINGRRIKENYIHQAEKAFLNLTDICQKINRSIPVRGAILFVGEHSEVRVDSKIEDIEVIVRHQLRKYILQIAREEQENYHVQIDYKKIISQFERNEVLNPFRPKISYSALDLEQGKKGIHCEYCKSYNILISKKFVRCKCGHAELRRAAILRMIDEYRVLTFSDPYFVRSEIEMFLGGQVSKSYLVSILNENFQSNCKNKYTKYN